MLVRATRRCQTAQGVDVFALSAKETIATDSPSFQESKPTWSPSAAG